MQEELMIAPCSYEAIRFACIHFHYAHRVPSGKIVKQGVWENGKFKGCIVYGDSSNVNMATPYNLDYTQVCELRRVALINHEHTVTEIISKSLKLLHKTNPSLELVISYADKNQNHLGIIYQAGNWIYEGETPDRVTSMIVEGKKIHHKSVYDRYGTCSIRWIKKHIDPNAVNIYEKGKYKYIYPLTKRARKMFSDRSKPYPKSMS